VIELTPGWRGQYAFTGDDWEHLAKMTSSTSQDRKDFILEHIDDPTGDRLVSPAYSEAADKATRGRVWQNLAGSFHAEGNPADSGLVNSVIGTISSLVSKISHGGSDASPSSPNPADNSTNAAAPAR
jgi:hypothetical protein